MNANGSILHMTSVIISRVIFSTSGCEFGVLGSWPYSDRRMSWSCMEPFGIFIAAGIIMLGLAERINLSLALISFR
jgi:hypothetical protein